MQYLLGIDGGGTKTAYLLCDHSGRAVASCTGPGCSYKQHGDGVALDTLVQHVAWCARQAGVGADDRISICAGLPCYGEAPAQDEAFAALLRARLAPAALRIVNDAEVGWAGSLAGQPGVNIVAGTGSIAFGVDAEGRSARCGGWSWVFGDEGSCHWAGMKTMELFSKEADGRLPKGALYETVRAALALDDDMEFVQHMEKDYCPSRKKTAAFQQLLCTAAEHGDPAAVDAYRMAAQELALIVKGVAGRLGFSGPVRVSYSGGIFRAGTLILEPFAAMLPAPGYQLCIPLLTPVEGAVLLAFRQFLPGNEAAAVDVLLARSDAAAESCGQ